MVSNRSMPQSTVVPVLIYEDVSEAIDWLCDTFGFVERWRADRHGALLSIGDGWVMIGERRVAGIHEVDDPTIFRAPRRGEVSHSMIVRLEDVDAHYERARQRGARILRPLTDFPFGERQYTTEDLEGHRWTFTQSIADVAPEEWGGTSVS